MDTVKTKYIPLDADPPFVFLDTALCASRQRESYFFTKPIHCITAYEYADIDRALREIDVYAKKYWLAGYIAYEAVYGWEEQVTTLRKKRTGKDAPLVWFGVFEEPHQTVEKGTDVVFDEQPDAFFREPISLKHTLSYTDYKKALTTIKRWIGRGHTYQVNFTYDVMLRTALSAPLLYRRLRRNQATPYCAYLHTGDDQIMSFSPELFFAQTGKTITVKPMKGTARRGRWEEEDRETVAAFKRDVKNASENIMIVDLLRNDLGRICTEGSVTTTRVCDIEKHATLYQMTSTITGTVKKDVSYSDTIKNIFPSGSVTGAPKIRTMQIIGDVEKGNRGVYCGAIGYISPRKKAVFNVPIRTLHKKNNRRAWTYRVGSGIVWDSRINEEWQECHTKCAFLQKEEPPAFELFETLLWKSAFVYKAEHTARLRRSAQYFSYPYEARKLAGMYHDIESALSGERQKIVRIFLNARGEFRYDTRESIDPGAVPKTVLFSREKMDPQNIFLYHKTTYRPWYAGAMERARVENLFDVLFCNTADEVTEGAISNIFIQKGKKWYTPPVSCGLLPGILRQKLLSDGKCREKKLSRQEVLNADAVYCGNSVRGLIKVTVR